MPTLTARQQAFIDAMLQDPGRCPTKAARAAGYSHRSAKETGYRLMRSSEYSHVQKAYTEAAQRIALEACNVSKSDVYRFFKAQMFVDRVALIQKVEQGRMQDLTEDEQLVIEGIRKVVLNDGTGDTITVPILADRQKAGIQMAKMLGLTVEKHEHKVDLTVAEAREKLSNKLARLRAARDQAAEVIAPSTN